MIEKMKFLSITGPKTDIDRVVNTYLSKYEIHLENALSELTAVESLSPFMEINPYKEALSTANSFYDELADYIVSIGEKKFRAAQLYSWMHEKLACSYDEMTNISDKLKKVLKENTLYTCLEPVRVQESQIDGTKKYLFRLYDGNLIESVFMRYHHGNSVCISSQVGCKMGCRFCASTLNGCVRNLEPSEMLDQIYRIQSLTGERVSNVVIMGSGEPMDNYDNVVKFLGLINSDKGLNISQRNITVSTCGLVPRIKQLAELKLQITLAISLHAPNDELRKTMMPIAYTYSIEQIMDATELEAAELETIIEKLK